MSIYNSQGQPVKGKSKAGAIAALLILVIIFGGLGAWVVYESNRSVDMMNEGCEPRAWNQWGQPTLWNCPAGADVDMTGMSD